MTSPILRELLQHTTALRALARELVGDVPADDIVQEAVIRTMTAPPRRSGPAVGWLATVVRNLASKHRRAERTRHRHEAEAARPEATPPDRSAEDADTLRRLTEIVTSLPEPYRGTILARYLREQTPSEIAAETFTPVRTVKTRLQRGLVLLRQHFDEGGGDWRGLLIGAFALDQPAAASGPALLGTTMKLLLATAVLLPIGFVIWNNLADSTPAPIESDLAVRRSLVEATAPSTESTAGRGEGRHLGTEVSPGLKAAMVDAAGPELHRDAGDPIANETARPVTAPEHDLEPAADPPLMRLHVVGPAAFRSAFLPTKLCGLFASLEGERMWRPLLALAERIWQQWDGRGDDFEASVDGQRVRFDALHVGGLGDESLCESRAFAAGDHPSDYVPAEDVEDHVEVVVGPLARPFQLGDVPGPDLVWLRRQQLWLLVVGVTKLISAFSDFAFVGEDPVHRALGAEIGFLIEQRCVDLSWRLVDETLGAQDSENTFSFSIRQPARRSPRMVLAGGSDRLAAPVHG